MSFLVIIGVVVALAVGLFAYERSRMKPLNDQARRQAPGDFVYLSHGAVHYQLLGEEDKPLIVFVHGFSTPSFVWRGLLPSLTEAGYRVLIYDLYGRGWSARPDVRHDAQLYDDQLTELLAALHLEGKMSFVGYSMGGAIVTYFAAHHSDRVSAVGLIAPAGLSVNAGGGAVLFQLPLIGDWLMAVRGRQFMLDVMRRPENQGKAVPDIVARYEAQMDYEGYLSALLSTLRNFPMDRMEGEYRAVGREDFPVLAIFGGQDQVVPISNVERLKRLVPRVQLARLDRAFHALTYSEPEFVSRALIDFLGKRNHLNAQ